MDTIMHDLSSSNDSFGPVPKAELHIIPQSQKRRSPSHYSPVKKSDPSACFVCGIGITSRYLFRCNGWPFHQECLYCSVCKESLNNDQTCYLKDDQLYCKKDYVRQYTANCSKCQRMIQSSDWVRRAKTNVYHLACFACENCKRQLSTGEEFALQDSKVLCKSHYLELIEGGSGSDNENNPKNKTKRVRTTFTEEQLQVLQANFQLDCNPDGQDLERIAQITGLSKRVTQVWFQNSRARQKKHQQQHNKQQGSNHSPIISHNNNGSISPHSNGSSSVGRCIGNLAMLGMEIDEDEHMM